MISPIGSGYSTPVAIQRPDSISDLQQSAGSSSTGKKQVKTGVGSYQDSFEATPLNQHPLHGIQAQKIAEKSAEKVAEADSRRNYTQFFYTQGVYGNLFRRVDENVRLGKLNEAEKAEQSKAYRPDQVLAGQTNPAANQQTNVASLTADLNANMLSMIRV